LRKILPQPRFEPRTFRGRCLYQFDHRARSLYDWNDV